jgi:hypothetical protein
MSLRLQWAAGSKDDQNGFLATETNHDKVRAPPAISLGGAQKLRSHNARNNWHAFQKVSIKASWPSIKKARALRVGDGGGSARFSVFSELIENVLSADKKSCLKNSQKGKKIAGKKSGQN